MPDPTIPEDRQEDQIEDPEAIRARWNYQPRPADTPRRTGEGLPAVIRGLSPDPRLEVIASALEQGRDPEQAMRAYVATAERLA